MMVMNLAFSCTKCDAVLFLFGRVYVGHTDLLIGLSLPEEVIEQQKEASELNQDQGEEVVLLVRVST